MAFILDGACAEVLERHKAIRDALEAGDQDLSKLFGALETEINKHSSDLRKFAGL
jgi:t-SNARE complex subunit (syntaxin)